MYVKTLSVFILLMVSNKLFSNDLVLADRGKTNCVIVLSDSPSEMEQKAVDILTRYFKKVTGANLTLRSGRNIPAGCFISIGKTNYQPDQTKFTTPESFRIRSYKDGLVIEGNEKGIVYAAYYFIEQFLGCRKYDQGPAWVPSKEQVRIPVGIEINEAPAFLYRGVYFPAAADEEYRNWHRLQSLDDLWGIWGHSFDLLLPAAKYYKDHPEYFAFTGGKRNPAQLCLSNPDVYRLLNAALDKKIADWPQARYWSISPNDDPTYCECPECSKTDSLEGGPQGSLLSFVNKIAVAHPANHFTTLAYTYSAHPTRQLKAEKNVTVMLSSIDVLRTNPFPQEPTAKSFCQDLEGWKNNSDNIFIWDYCTQFTNYLAPFPSLHCFQPNYQYLKKKGVKGVFAQGSGDNYSDLAELKSYVLSKLLWNPDIKADSIIRDFLQGYYGKAGTYIHNYLDQMDNAVIETKTPLDIYGNPVNDIAEFLSPALIEQYSNTLDKAEALAEENPVFLERVSRMRQALDYASLQQARFYGREKHGVFQTDEAGNLSVRNGFRTRYEKFIARCRGEKIAALNENGKTLEMYDQEWQDIFTHGAKENLAYNLPVTLDRPHITDYAAATSRILVDGNKGFDDYSYNWLCFYNEPLVATIKLKKSSRARKISIGFLDDPRHWIFTPSKVTVMISTDGKEYTTVGEHVFQAPSEEKYNTTRIDQDFLLPENMESPYIKVVALPLSELPQWRYHKHKKPMLACDEIWVN